MNLLIVSGSQRSGSQSAKVANYLMTSAHKFTHVEHLELAQINLPYWDGTAENKNHVDNAWHKIRPLLIAADALVLITPEWGGMATPIIKNFLLMCDSQEVAHKPALLIAVSSGISGSYPIAELRMNALKNNRIVALPDHLILRNVVNILNQNDSSIGALTDREIHLRERIDYSLYMLQLYSAGLKQIRQQHQNQPFPKQQEYSYGM